MQRYKWKIVSIPRVQYALISFVIVSLIFTFVPRYFDFAVLISLSLQYNFSLWYLSLKVLISHLF